MVGSSTWFAMLVVLFHVIPLHEGATCHRCERQLRGDWAKDRSLQVKRSARQRDRIPKLQLGNVPNSNDSPSKKRKRDKSKDNIQQSTEDTKSTSKSSLKKSIKKNSKRSSQGLKKNTKGSRKGKGEGGKGRSEMLTLIPAPMTSPPASPSTKKPTASLFPTMADPLSSAPSDKPYSNSLSSHPSHQPILTPAMKPSPSSPGHPSASPSHAPPMEEPPPSPAPHSSDRPVISTTMTPLPSSASVPSTSPSQVPPAREPSPSPAPHHSDLTTLSPKMTSSPSLARVPSASPSQTPTRAKPSSSSAPSSPVAVYPSLCPSLHPSDEATVSPNTTLPPSSKGAPSTNPSQVPSETPRETFFEESAKFRVTASSGTRAEDVTTELKNIAEEIARKLSNDGRLLQEAGDNENSDAAELTIMLDARGSAAGVFLSAEREHPEGKQSKDALAEHSSWKTNLCGFCEDCSEVCFEVGHVVDNDVPVDDAEIQKAMSSRLADICAVHQTHWEVNPGSSVLFRGVPDCSPSGIPSTIPTIPPSNPSPIPSPCGPACIVVVSATGSLGIILASGALLAMLLLPVSRQAVVWRFDGGEVMKKSATWEEHVSNMKSVVGSGTESVLKSDVALKHSDTQVQTSQIKEDAKELIAFKLSCEKPGSRKETLARINEMLRTIANGRLHGLEDPDRDMKLAWKGSLECLLRLTTESAVESFEHCKTAGMFRIGKDKIEIEMTPAFEANGGGFERNKFVKDHSHEGLDDAVNQEGPKMCQQQKLSVLLPMSENEGKSLLGTGYHRRDKKDARFLRSCCACGEKTEAAIESSPVMIVLKKAEKCSQIALVREDERETIEKFESKGHKKIEKPEIQRKSDPVAHLADHAVLQFQGFDITLEAGRKKVDIKGAIAVGDVKKMVFDGALLTNRGKPVAATRQTLATRDNKPLDDQDTLWSHDIQDGDTLIWSKLSDAWFREDLEERRRESEALRHVESIAAAIRLSDLKSGTPKRLPKWSCKKWKLCKSCQHCDDSGLKCDPRLDLDIEPTCMPAGNGSLQDRLHLECTFGFGVDEMISNEQARGFFVEVVQFSLELEGSGISQDPKKITKGNMSAPEVVKSTETGVTLGVEAGMEAGIEAGASSVKVALPSAAAEISHTRGQTVAGKTEHWWIGDSLPDASWRFLRGTWTAPKGTEDRRKYDPTNLDSVLGIWGHGGSIPNASDCSADNKLEAEWTFGQGLTGDVMAKVEIILTMRAIQKHSRRFVSVDAPRHEHVFNGKFVLLNVRAPPQDR